MKFRVFVECVTYRCIDIEAEDRDHAWDVADELVDSTRMSTAINEWEESGFEEIRIDDVRKEGE